MPPDMLETDRLDAEADNPEDRFPDRLKDKHKESSVEYYDGNGNALE